ncbi:unnamed protein product [Cladocopium goreaui]|uniref:Uncharacterized protein n=1 Tax=Cladocopium goreaui TaxID=2562237 RepID=A0A9P1DVZ4_9DINO|nr:unnamed protein product [Cladocopium goreaui]
MGAGSPSGPRACCGPRSSNACCRNEFLEIFLAKLEEGNQEFDSAFLYKLQAKTGADAQDARYSLLYQRTELALEAPNEHGIRAVVPQKVRRLLRLDWSQDGLSFDEIDARLPETLLVQSKVFERPLRPAELLQHLAEVQNKVFDFDNWTSYDFCRYFMTQARRQSGFIAREGNICSLSGLWKNIHL